MIRFPGVIGSAAEFTISSTDDGEHIFLLNGIPVPAVLSQKLVIGDGVPKVVLEVAVKSYQGITKTLE